MLLNLYLRKSELLTFIDLHWENFKREKVIKNSFIFLKPAYSALKITSVE